jgi:hypothetical protein
MLKMPGPRLIGLAAACLWAVFAGATIAWLFLDRLPPNWDDAWYLTNSLTAYDALAHGGIRGYIGKLNSVSGFRAPLIAALPAPFYLLFGRRWHAAYLVNVVCMMVLCCVLYRIASRWWNERAALFAVAIACTMPLLYGLSRWYLVEYPLVALVSVSIWLLIESVGFERRGMALWLGVACGLGMLLKVSYAAFILPAFLYFWAGSRRLRSLALTALPCLVLTLPWYAGHLRPTIAHALNAGFGTEASVYGTGPILALSTIATYLSHLVANGISQYYAALTILLILWTASRPEGRVWFRGLDRKPAAVLFFWLLPLAFYLFGDNKDIRLIAPVLPALALLIACLLDSALPRTLPGAALAVLLLGVPAVQFFSVSFAVPYRAGDLGYARRFDRKPWPLDEILKVVAANSTLRPGEREMLLVGTDRAGFNADNIELTATALQLPFDIETTAHEKDFDALRLRLAEASFFLFKEGGEAESPDFNPYLSRLVPLVIDDSRYAEIFATPLPDGGIARIFKNSTTGSRPAGGGFLSSGAQIPEEFAVDFGGVVALTGFSTVKAPDGIGVRFRWRCLKPPDRDYWCFTHLIDGSGKIVAQRDHRLLGGSLPLPSWRADDGGAEEVHLAPPQGTAWDGLRLRFGLYDPATGDRLRVGPLQGAALSRFSLADQATAVLWHN